MAETQREHKDRLFKAIFGRNTDESKRWRLELYNLLNKTSLTDPDELKVNTIENVIYITMKNDISFLVDDQMVLYEQQSSFNQNMPLRGFLYFSQLYQKYLTENKQSVNRSNKVKIPTPRFFVFYNGMTKKDNAFKMRLSDSFIVPDNSGDFEWTATVVNINLNDNESLVKNCVPLYDYARFVAKVREFVKQGKLASSGVESAVNWAIDKKLLDGFFERQKAEIMGMILTEFDQEIYEQNVREDGYEDGLVDGARKKAMEAATNALKMNLSPEQTAAITGLTLREALDLQKQLATEAAESPQA